MSGTGTSALPEIFDPGPVWTAGLPPADDMAAILVAAQHRAGPLLKIRRHRSPDAGPPYWRWDCDSCGEYGGGRHHADAISRAERHCKEHPEHRSSLLPPPLCREPDQRLAVHPMLFAVDDDPPPRPFAL
ncbi:hypothetical protein ACIBSW_03240 [Actinoplanes sp. NPDC049668]|uniref:hypothetical protein n=1 Tax=unclassified Actinoplanes TaxID=2626549 RepID=UPI0033ADCFB7